MTALIFKLLGGIGLFLMGMVLLTDGLKAVAGEALRRALVRFTGTPLKAFASGALVTALVQSSSATTVTVIGFVSAGLLGFPQALGVVIGASLGTTGTGWLVAVLGLKVSLGLYALPLVGLGAFLKLLGRGRARSLGLALAGFGLIFIGIETLQAGMQGLAGVFNFAKLPAGGLLGHLLTMILGIVMTVVMQSSSAAVATTLTALHSGAINFEQAASLVIGAAIGTTVTGALAAIGGSSGAKRTALAHVLFNLATGLIAILLLPIFLWGIAWAQAHAGLDPGATSLAAFHTAFIALGALVFLPLTKPFAGRIERWIPERGPRLTRHLDDTLLHAPPVALETTVRAWREIARETFATIQASLDSSTPRFPPDQLELLSAAMDETQHFFARIPPAVEDEPLSQRRIAQLHAIDHLTRLQAHLRPEPALRRALSDEQIRPLADQARELLQVGAQGLVGGAPEAWLEQVERHAAALAQQRRTARPLVLAQTAQAHADPTHALEVLDAMRWLDRVGYHTWRICHYLAGNANTEPPGVLGGAEPPAP